MGELSMPQNASTCWKGLKHLYLSNHWDNCYEHDLRVEVRVTNYQIPGRMEGWDLISYYGKFEDLIMSNFIINGNVFKKCQRSWKVLRR